MRKVPIWRRYARLFGPNPKADVQEELRFHLDERDDDLVARGWNARAAREEAERQFGDLERIKTMGEQLGRERAERNRRREYWGEFLQDVRFGWRMLRKQPGFTAIAVATLAFGIGATAAVFTLIQSVLLTPPPYREPGQLVVVSSRRTDGQPMTSPRSWPSMQWQDWQKQAKSFDGIAGYAWGFLFLVRSEGSESMEGMTVSPDYFQVTGLQPMLGRTFLPSEGQADGPQVMILGYGLWQRAFQGDPNIVGKEVRISRQDVPSTVVGVMPPGIRFLPSPRVAQEPNYDVNAEVDYWRPAIPAGETMRQPRWDVVARLRPGVTREQAESELATLTAAQSRQEREFEGFAPQLASLKTVMNSDGERILLPLLGAAALVFLIACGNVAALLLVRGLQRQQEYAVRSALGVGRAALFRQVSTESLLLALLGGTLGVGLAVALVKLFQSVGGRAVPRLDGVTIGWPVLAWGFGAAAIAATIAGLLPAIRASRFDPSSVLKSAGPKSSAGLGERRLLRAVTVAQIAMTLALLAGAGLLVRTMHNIASVESGFDTSRVLTMSVTMVQGDWQQFHHLALERVSAVPGVEAAAFAWGVPLTGNSWTGSLEIEGQPPAAKLSDRPVIPIRSVTPGYFELLRLAVLDGRDFRDSDARGAAAVAIVNQAFARKYFGGASPVGRKLVARERQSPNIDVVGLVENSRTNDLTKDAEPELYVPLWQNTAFSKHLVIRSTADPRTVMTSIRSALRGVDPTVSVENLKTLEEIRDDSLSSRNFAMRLLGGFALIGGVLTLVGIYGVLSLSVAARRKELAIRVAMGADAGDIRSLVFREGFSLIGPGIAAGLVAALLLARVLRTFLYGVTPEDPATLAGAGLVFAAVALLAAWIPMRRAAGVDPMEALRDE